MQTALRSPIPDASLAVFPVNGENSHQGFEGRNPALHPVREACKFTVLLGLRGQAKLNRIGSRCTGKERDTESGLDYFGARYYGSNMGRFQSPDSLMGDPENPQSWNLYSYVQNNPVTKTDPDGHDVRVCDNNGQCNTVSNDAYTAAQQGNNSGLNVPTLNQVGGNSNSNDTFNATAITNSSGQTVGTATYVPENPGIDPYIPSNAAGYSQLSNTSQVVKAGVVAYAGAYGAAACLVACPAGAAAVGRWGLQRLAVGASSPALLNLINRIYQAQDEIPGGTAGAVRNEVATGEFINGGHAIKAQEMISAITKLINSGELSGGDQTIAGHIISDLKNSLGK
jgi:RHS repeat-associated protein